MKRIKILAALLFLFCGTSLYAKDFDWSECWCNYGGGIEKGDLIVTAGGGLYFADLAYSTYDGFWFYPPVMVEVQIAQPVWKLPFTFGGYAGVRGYGYEYRDYNGKLLKTECWTIVSGAEAEYHVMLPPEGLDVYAVARLGGCFPVIKPNRWSYLDYFSFGTGIGANWYFGKVFGVNLEFGYPFAKFGVSLKF